ncbi:MAG TPA: hypothetical protein PK347_00345 [Burkholderiaceae bacterium]|nr:hypothetical protein [Burkholderiaceae bacterium]
MAEQTLPANYWQPIDTAPTGRKVLLQTMQGVSVFGVVTANNRADYAWWAPMPQHH